MDEGLELEKARVFDENIELADNHIDIQEIISKENAYDMAIRVLLSTNFVISKGDDNIPSAEIVLPNMRGYYVSSKAKDIYELVDVSVKKLQRYNYRLREFDRTEKNIARIVKALKNILDALEKLY